MTSHLIHRAAIGAAVAATLATLTVPAAASDWQWDITPYAWVPSVGADVAVDGEELLGTTIDEKDVVDKLDFVVQVDVQAQRGQHGFLLDLNYADFSDDEKRRPLGGPLDGELVTKGDFEQTLVDIGGLWNPSGDGSGFALLYGARILDVDQEVDAFVDGLPGGPSERVRIDVGSTYLDALVGARYLVAIGDSWQAVGRVDVSAGQTELTWSALLAGGYSFGPDGRYTALLGYRHLEVEFEESDDQLGVTTTTTMSGFVAALRIGL